MWFLFFVQNWTEILSTCIHSNSVGVGCSLSVLSFVRLRITLAVDGATLELEVVIVIVQVHSIIPICIALTPPDMMMVACC